MTEICTYNISIADANLAQARQGVLESTKGVISNIQNSDTPMMILQLNSN